MKKKRLFHNYLKPHHYYSRLFTFFMIVSVLLTLTLVQFTIESLDLFLLKVIVIMFLILVIAVVIEFFSGGEYMNPLEIYDLEYFYGNLFYDFLLQDKSFSQNFLKYTSLESRFIQTFSPKRRYFLSTIRKQGDGVYLLSVIDERKLFEYFFVKFLVRKAVHKLTVKKFKGGYKIIHIS